jgi:hypothetical protein
MREGQWVRLVEGEEVVMVAKVRMRRVRRCNFGERWSWELCGI